MAKFDKRDFTDFLNCNFHITPSKAENVCKFLEDYFMGRDFVEIKMSKKAFQNAFVAFTIKLTPTCLVTIFYRN